MKKSHPQQEPQNPQTQKPEPLYAQVDKSRRRGGPRILSPEEIQAANKRQPLQEDPYDRPRGREQTNSPYNTRRMGAGGYDTPSQRPLETPYAPQNPLGRTVYAPQYPLGATRAAAAGRGSREPSPENPTNPYQVTNLGTGEIEFQEQINPLYDSPNGSSEDLRHSPRPEEHLYAEIDPRTQGRRPPHKPLETIYTTLGAGAEGGERQQQENPLYEGIGRATTPPPRTQKDVITTKLLQDTGFQYGVRETQEWCTIVYGNPHALNKQLAEILDNPQGAEKILWDLAEKPESPGKLAGLQVLGVKSPDRKEAEDGFRHLCSSLERHIHKAQRLHKEFTRDLEKDQKQESPEHRHHHRRHARGQERNSPEHSPRQQRQGESRGMAHAM